MKCQISIEESKNMVSVQFEKYMWKSSNPFHQPLNKEMGTPKNDALATINYWNKPEAVLHYWAVELVPELKKKNTL